MASLPTDLPSLSVLVEKVRAPEAARAEVDALLAGLTQPLPPAASPRKRADLLLSLIEDAQIADYTGTGGRTVREAAIEALLALGYPYALEVPPEALAAAQRQESTGPLQRTSRKAKVGFRLVALAGAVQMIPVVSAAIDSGSHSSWNILLGMATVLILATTFLPAWLIMVGRNKGNAILKLLGQGWLTLTSLSCLGSGALTLGSSSLFGLSSVAIGGMMLAGAILMGSED